MPRDEAAQADRDNDPEPDCKHGCHGDCLFNGSDKCTWQCHSYDNTAPYLKHLIVELENQRDTAATKLYAIKGVLMKLATDEIARKMAGWNDTEVDDELNRRLGQET